MIILGDGSTFIPNIFSFYSCWFYFFFSNKKFIKFSLFLGLGFDGCSMIIHPRHAHSWLGVHHHINSFQQKDSIYLTNGFLTSFNICMYVCMYVSIYLFLCVCARARPHMYIYTHTHLYMCVCVCVMYTHIYVEW